MYMGDPDSGGGVGRRGALAPTRGLWVSGAVAVPGFQLSGRTVGVPLLKSPDIHPDRGGRESSLYIC